LRAADVAVISRERWAAVDPNDNLRGAPELVVEVKSPSNTPGRLRELVALCLANGSVECWIVDQEKKSVSVFQRDGAAVAYGIGDALPLSAFGADELLVAEIFE
jgi:Uma2 family endonuclease